MRPRVIPCLLLKGTGLVKTIQFSKPVYLGDPRNVVKLFNDKEADEIILLDIDASKRGTRPNVELLKEIVNESFMPLGYGGGISDVATATALVSVGIEKVVLNSAAVANTSLITECAERLGSQSIVVSIDVKRHLIGSRYGVYAHRTGQLLREDPRRIAQRIEAAGAGELFINSVDRDGTMTGYDLELISSIASAVTIPVIACGGARNVGDLAAAVAHGASAAAAGSMFVFHGALRAVLISFPTSADLQAAFGQIETDLHKPAF